MGLYKVPVPESLFDFGIRITFPVSRFAEWYSGLEIG